MISPNQPSNKGVRRLVSPLRSIWHGLKGTLVTAASCLARLEFRVRAVSVRELQAGELARVQAAFRAVGAQARPSDLLGQANGQTGIVVAWLGTRPVGIGFVHWAGPRDAELQQRWPGVPEIYRLWVRPRYRTVGVGSRIVHHIESLVLTRELGCIGLGVHESNLRAHALYLRLHYQPDRQTYVDRYVEQGLDGQSQLVSRPAIFMIKTLKPACGVNPVVSDSLPVRR